MEKPGPILSGFDLRRAIAMGVTSPRVHVAQLGAEEARLVIDLAYVQETPRGLLHTPVLGDFFAVGPYDSFAGRGIEATITSTDKYNPFSYKFSVRETTEGISYVTTLVEGPDIESSQPLKTEYSFREPLIVPRQISRDDLRDPKDNHTLSLNEAMTQNILVVSGAPLLAPKDN